MNNFVLLYHFEDKKVESSFEKEILDKFPRHQVEETGNFRYFGFADRAEPGVVDKLNTFLNRVDNSMNDYVALYSAKKQDTDKITRTMLVGHDNVLETKVEKLSFDAHRNSLTKLLELDFTKEFGKQE